MAVTRVEMKKRRVDSGFSLIELLISIGIIATVLLYIMGVFTTGMRANRKSVDLTSGTLVAESVISRELYDILADSQRASDFFGATYGADSNTAYVQGSETLDGTVYTYKLYVSDVSMQMAGTDASTTGMGNAIKKVDVQVWWWTQDEEAAKTVNPESSDSVENNAKSFKQGYGVASVGLSRLINQQSKY